MESYEEVVLNEDSIDLSEEEEVDTYSYPAANSSPVGSDESDPELCPSFSELTLLPQAPEVEDDSSKTKAVVIGEKNGYCLVQTLPENGQCSYYKLDNKSICLNIDRKAPMPGVFVFITIVGLEDLAEKDHLPESKLEEMKHPTSVWIKKRITEFEIDDLAVSFYEKNGYFVTGTEDGREQRFKQRQEPDYFGEETMKQTVVLVVQPKTDHPNVICVVGEPAKKGFMAQCNLDVKQNQYVKARVMKSAPFFTLRYMFDTLCLLKNHKEEDEYNNWTKTNMERFETHRELITEIYKDHQFEEEITKENIEQKSLVLSTYKNCVAPRDGLPLLQNFEKLSKREQELIRTQCRGVKDVTLEMARMYIRDPAYICCRVSSFEVWRKAQQFRVEQKARCNINGRKYTIELILNAKEADKVTKQKEDGCWKIGSELKIEHEALKRQRIGMHGVQNKRTAFVRIDSIDKIFGGKVKFTFVSSPASLEIFNVLCDARKRMDGAPPKIGPEDEDSSSDNIALGLKNFDKFYENKRLFDRYRGVINDDKETDNEEEDKAYETMNLLREMDLESDISDITLDVYQREALRSALNNLYFTAIQAPPGTGKTHLISTLKVKSHASRPHKRMMVTATTNNAINNAVEKTVTLRPGYHIIRDMSIQGEEVASELLREYTLNTRCLRSLPDSSILGQEDKLKEKLAKALFEYQAAKRSFDDVTNRSEPFKRLNILELIHDTHSILKRTYIQAAVPYVVASTPTILNRHGRQYDPTARYTARGYSASGSISHLIVDEASQLPAYMALALYCSFPDLERITIIGDSKQLGPHCLQEKKNGFFLYEMMTLSELDRVVALKKTTHTCRLMYNYRCHPELNNKLLSTIYKDNLHSGLREDQRHLHLTHQLPVSRTNSGDSPCPIRFYNIEGNGEKGYNVWEMNEVINLLRNLLINAQPGHRLDRKNVVVLCFHKRQRLEIEKAIMTYIPDHSEKKEEIRVSTIDSYQGKECKVVLVCTTKTCENEKDAHIKMSFVADSRRCTVALSRAQEAVYIFGQWSRLLKTSFWREYEPLISNGFKESTTGKLRCVKKSESNKENIQQNNQRIRNCRR